MAYASKYYDPVKAHEYYMKNRELKGYKDRYGGSRGNGTSAASSPSLATTSTSSTTTGSSKSGGSVESLSSLYRTINNKYDSEIDGYRNKMKSEIDSYANEIKRQNESYKSQIADCMATIKGVIEDRRALSREERKARKEEFAEALRLNREKIKELRAEKKERAKELREKIKALRNQRRKKLQEMRNKQRAEKREAYLQNRSDKLAEADLKYEERSSSTKSGSTSGFNEKGKEAAEYIKDQMEKERSEAIKKVNKSLDDKMMNQVEALRKRMKSARESGSSFDKKKFKQELDRLIGKTKTLKAKEKTEQVKAYKTKYKQEIDKLRNDKSMHSYYDRRAVKLEKWKEQDADYNERETRRLNRQNSSN